MKNDQGWIENNDGTKLFWRRLAPSQDATGVLLFVHGLAEHSGRYTHVMEHFTARGYDCWAFDYRGHGQSSGPRVHVHHFDEFLMDLRATHSMVREKCPGMPLVLVGHSQGGLVALRYTLAYPDDLDGIIVSSPFLGIHPSSQPNPVLRGVARVLSMVTPRLMLSKPPDASLLSRDPEVGPAYLADPLTSYSVSARWFTEVTAAHRDTRERAGALKARALVMQSGADRLADPAATRAWVNAAPAGLVDYVEWEGFYHEMFNEPEKEQVFEHIEAWLRDHLPEAD